MLASLATAAAVLISCGTNQAPSLVSTTAPQATEASQSTQSSRPTQSSATTSLLAVKPSDPETDEPAVTAPESAVPQDVDPADQNQTAVERPKWLGTRTLPTRGDGSVAPQTTPEELSDRRLITVDSLPPPTGPTFEASATPLGAPENASVLARSTWTEDCPVPLGELTYITVSFWGFDETAHTGELIVHASAADDLTAVMAKLFAAKFPIEEMRIVTQADVDADPTGDGNVTSSFVCRTVTGGTSYSQHAFGLAIDINPFHNPYQRGDLVLPELATDYTDRGRVLPGMVTRGDVVEQAFAEIGWTWGGDWNSLKDYQHFSANGR